MSKKKLNFREWLVLKLMGNKKKVRPFYSKPIAIKLRDTGYYCCYR